MTKSREQITAEHISLIIPDLHLIDTDYYIDNIRHHRMANIADIVNSATELYFLPHTLHFGEHCYYRLDEHNHPTIIFQMIFSHRGVYIEFYLSLSKHSFGIKITNSHFLAKEEGFEANTNKLKHALQDALLSNSLKKTFN